MAPKTHSAPCVARAEKVRKAGAEYKIRFPNSCDACQATGVVVTYGGRLDPDSYDPCDNCLGKGRCPVCGKQHPEDWAAEQCDCGWRWDGSGAAELVMPPAPGCTCDWEHGRENMEP